MNLWHLSNFCLRALVASLRLTICNSIPVSGWSAIWKLLFPDVYFHMRRHPFTMPPTLTKDGFPRELLDFHFLEKHIFFRMSLSGDGVQRVHQLRYLVTRVAPCGVDRPVGAGNTLVLT